MQVGGGCGRRMIPPLGAVENTRASLVRSTEPRARPGKMSEQIKQVKKEEGVQGEDKKNIYKK